ncbi:DUF4405 domain-containing protein [Peptococcaceae bacterium]|nr:DUF4405 domain-containing protein [Peptococcaceae bacterium]
MITIKLKAIISTALIVLFVLVLITGIGLYLSPSGQVAKEINWSFLGFNKWELGEIHVTCSFIMAGLILLHLFLNFKMFLSEIKSIFKSK